MEIQAYSYEQLDREIKRTMKRSADDLIKMGYLLRHMMEERLWERQYLCFDEYLDKELHMDYTMATRFIKANKKYSDSEDSMKIDAKWNGYSQSVLIEMLNIPPDLEEKVTPDMTVRQVRKVKKQKSIKMKPDVRGLMNNPYCAACGEPLDDSKRPQKCLNCGQAQDWEWYTGAFCDKDQTEETVVDGKYKEIPLSAYGFHKTEYPEGSLLTTAGCGHQHDCFSCVQECNIRQEERMCREATCGNPYGCQTMSKLGDIKWDKGDKCQFINLELTYKTTGSGEPDPCCKECILRNECDLCCDATKLQVLQENENVATSQEPVSTQSDEVLQEEFLTEIEEESEQEELNVKFNTDELLDELDVIDAECQEVDETKEEPIATSQYQRTAPDSRQNEYLDAFARYFISCEHDWMIQDLQNRVLDVTRSPEEIKKHLQPQCRWWSFKFADDIAMINLFDDYVQVLDGRSNWIGDFDWFYLVAAIQRMWNVVALERAEKEVLSKDGKDSREENENDGDTSDPESVDEMAIVRSILEQEKKTLNAYLEFGDIPENTVYRQKTIVCALAAMICDFENMQEKEAAAAEVQPEFPKFRNDDERKAWINDVEAWGLWYEDSNIGAKYYKYDFPDGSRVIAVRYRYTCPPWIKNKKDRDLDGTFKDTYYHMIYSDAYKKINEYAYEKYYVNTTSSITELVKFIKEISKKG